MKKITFLSTVIIFTLNFIFLVFSARADVADPHFIFIDNNHIIVTGVAIIIVVIISLIVLIKIRRKNKKNNADH